MSRLARSSAVQTRIAKLYTPQVVQQLAQIEQDLGGRDELIGMLVLAPLNADLRYVLGMLGDPQHARKSLAAICGLGNILPGDLLKHLASAALLRGKVLASQKIGNGIAAVAADIMTRAAPYEDACHTCLGVGTVTPEPTTDQPNPSPEPCEVCQGMGKLTYRPDLERQRLAVDLAHLLPKSGGIQIAQINQGGSGERGSGGASTFDAVQRVVDQVLYGEDAGSGAAVEAEIADGEEETDGDPDQGGGDAPEPDPAGSPR